MENLEGKIGEKEKREGRRKKEKQRREKGRKEGNSRKRGEILCPLCLPKKSAKKNRKEFQQIGKIFLGGQYILNYSKNNVTPNPVSNFTHIIKNYFLLCVL